MLCVTIAVAIAACGGSNTGESGGEETEGQPISRPASAPAGQATEAFVPLPPLSAPRPCGHQFGATDAEATIRLLIELDDPSLAASGQLDASTSLVAGPWSASFQVGTGLRNNWCADTDLDPAPVIDQQWEVVAGVLEIVEMPADADQCLGATALIRGIGLRRPDGLEIGLSDLELTNSAWGCFG